MRLPVHLALYLTLAMSGTAPASESQANSPSAPVLAPRLAQNWLPDLGSSANATLSRAEEYQVGRMMVRDLRSQNAVLDDAETSDYLQSLGARIGVEAQRGEQRLNFFAIRDRSLNAFALPGGFIGLHTGLILRTDSESELAGVVAHEIGHVVQRHIARAVEAQGRINLTALAGLLGAVLVGATTGNADAMPGLIAMGQGAAMQQQINFTRMEEHEADRVGIGYLAAAGFDPNGMATFFAKMMRDRGVSLNDIPSLLLTHPVDSVRLSEARAHRGHGAARAQAGFGELRLHPRARARADRGEAG
jgi:predicted Zn-dependent protease